MENTAYFYGISFTIFHAVEGPYLATCHCLSGKVEVPVTMAIQWVVEMKGGQSGQGLKVHHGGSSSKRPSPQLQVSQGCQV
jgi:hypothetical protein